MDRIILWSVILLVLINGTALCDNEIEINTKSWDESPIAGSVETIVIDKIINAKTKSVIPVKNVNKALKINIYSTIYRNIQEVMNMGKHYTVRCTEIIFSWMPLGSKLGGEVTMMLIDTRQEGSERIKGQATYRPDRPVVAIFYQNYAVTLSDIKYLDFEIHVNGVNMQKGNFGQVSLYWKTIIGPAMKYREKPPVIFYIPIDSLPETEVMSSEDIFKLFAKKAQTKREKEVAYFSSMRNFIDRTMLPFNYAQSDIEEVKATLEEKQKIAQKYVDELVKYQPKSLDLDNIKAANQLIFERRKMLDDALQGQVNRESIDDKALVSKYKQKSEPMPLEIPSW